MNYESFQANIESKISFYLESGNKTELGKFRHHKTLLRKIVEEYEIAEPDYLPVYFQQNFPEVERQFKAFLIDEGKDPRSHMSRLRNLQKYYISLNDIAISNSPISEVLTDAAKKMYGDKLFTGEVTPETQKKIKAKYVTLRQIATDIVKAGVEKNPALWPAVSLDNKASLTSASKVVRDYFSGDSVPTERISDERILFIESYMGLPEKSILSKVIRKKTLSTHSDRKKKQAARSKRNSQSEENRIEDDFYKLKTLNKNLSKLFDEYKDFKTKSIQPRITNISEQMKKFADLDFDIEVKEKTKRKNGAWTLNTQGTYPSALGFYKHLLFFQNYCVNIENIDLEDISSFHLTNYKLLRRMTSYVKEKALFGSAADRLLNFINLGCQKSGYLRLCGERADRTLEAYFFELDHIADNYQSLSDDAKKGIRKRGEGQSSGKKNIKFLCDMPVKERRTACHNASVWLIQQADNLTEEAQKELKTSKKAKTESSKQKKFDKAGFFASKALNKIVAAVVMESSFINAPRAINWTTLKYCSSAKYKMENEATLTYHSHKNQFQLYVPLYGNDISNINDHVRLIKNSDSKNAVPIDVYYPEYLTPLFKKLLKVRDLYINTHMVSSVRKTLPKLKNQLRDLNLLTSRDIESNLKEKRSQLSKLEDISDSYRQYELEKIEKNSEIEQALLQQYASAMKTSSEKVELKNIQQDVKRLQQEITDYEAIESPDFKKLLVKNLRLDIKALEEFSKENIDNLIPSLSYRLGETKRLSEVADLGNWETNRILRRNFVLPPSKLSENFKAMTCDAFHFTCDEYQWGLNIHAMRHLAAETHLDLYPGDYEGAAAILNDEVEQVIKVYGRKDRAKAMKSVAEKGSCIEIRY